MKVKFTTGTSINIARTVCLILICIHLVLPFTALNHHDEPKIIYASMVIATIFIILICTSFSFPQKSVKSALTILLFIFLISHLSGASPITEGIVIKLLFISGLVQYLWQSGKRANK